MPTFNKCPSFPTVVGGHGGYTAVELSPIVRRFLRFGHQFKNAWGGGGVSVISCWIAFPVSAWRVGVYRRATRLHSLPGWSGGVLQCQDRAQPPCEFRAQRASCSYKSGNSQFKRLPKHDSTKGWPRQADGSARSAPVSQVKIGSVCQYRGHCVTVRWTACLRQAPDTAS